MSLKMYQYWLIIDGVLWHPQLAIIVQETFKILSHKMSLKITLL